MPDKPGNRRLDVGAIEVVEEAVAAILRAKTPAERILQAAAAHRTARALMTAQIRSQHPDWNDEQISRELLRRLTGGTN
jgi:hypothetical protein